MKPSIFIGVPCFGAQVYAHTTAALCELHTRLTLATGEAPTIQFNSDPACPRARNEMASSFLATKCTHLMFIDADMTFDASDVLRLASSGLDLVAGAYPRKSPAGGFIVDLAPEHVAANAFPTATVDGVSYLEVEHVGTGFMCIRRRVFETMLAKLGPDISYTSDSPATLGQVQHDFFAMGPDPHAEPGRRRYLSEDYLFCTRWRRLGGKVYAHPGVKLRHVGPHVFEGDFRAWVEGQVRAAQKQAAQAGA